MNSLFRRLTALFLCISLLCGLVPTAFAATLKITAQPKPASAYDGERATTTVTATGDGLTYRWYIAKAGSSKFSKSSVTKATYGCVMSETSDGRQAYCVVTDQNGNTAKSNTVTLSLRTALAVTKQPKSVTVASGAKATVSIASTGDGLTYAWYYKNPGATKFSKTTAFTGKTYSVTMDASRDGRQVYCVVKDKYGSTVQTKTATLSMQTPLKITQQPKSVTAAGGETAKVTLKATGDNLTYTWYFKNAGASKFSKTTSFTGTTYSVKMDTSRAGRQVYCIIKDKWGNSVKTNTVTLSMQTALKITQQPKSVAVKDGETAKVTLKATGDNLTYTWYFKNAGASKFTQTTTFTGNSYSVKMDESRSGRQVYCVVKDQYGHSVQTDTVTLTVENPLVILTQPQDMFANSGETVTFTVDVTGGKRPYTYLWWGRGVDDTFVALRTSENKFTAEVDEYGRWDDELDDFCLFEFWCEIIDADGKSIESDWVTIRENLRIVTQPESVAVPNGLTAAVTFEATGEDLSYTWYFKNPGAAKFGKTDTFTGNSYSIKMDESRSGRQVYCVVKDKYGNSVQTDTVTLSMQTQLKITNQPTDAWARNGEMARVTVDAVGDGLTYTWYFRNAGADKFSKTDTFKGSTYEVTMNDSRVGRQVYCVVQDKYGNSVQSNTVYLIMDTPVEIVTQPKSITVQYGTIAAVAFEATGADLTYTWYFKNPGAETFAPTSSFTGSTYSVKMDENCDGCEVYCKVTDRFGNWVITDTVTLGMVPHGLDYDIKDGEVLIVDYDGVASTLRIPENINGYPVTQISNFAFEYSDTLEYVIIPDCVTYVGYCAFDSCSNLKSVRLPAGLSIIDDCVFSDCESLTGITIPYGVTKIGVEAFGGCTALESVTLPSSVTFIDKYAFSNCTSLLSVTLPDQVTHIGKDAFSGCSSLQSITIPEGVDSILEGTFAGCYSLLSVELPDGLISIGDAAFSVCTALANITLPDGLQSIGASAFQLCSSLNDLWVPSSVETIGDLAFYNCENLLILCSAGSAVYSYCLENELPCDAVSKYINLQTGVQEAWEMGLVVYVDMWTFWAMEGMTDVNGYECPQYVSITDTTLYRDTSVPDETNPEAWVSADYLYETYLKDGGYAHLQQELLYVEDIP